MASLDPPTISAPHSVIKYWMQKQSLRSNEFTFRSIRVIVLKLKDRSDDLREFMNAIKTKEFKTRCAIVTVREKHKRVQVSVDGKKRSIFWPELVYKIFRNIGGTRKNLIARHCEPLDEDDDEDVDGICINPYHYQMVDRDGENVPDELNADERRAMELALYFPVVDVNDLPDRIEAAEENDEEKSEEEVVDEEKSDEEVVDEEHFLSGAARALSSTVVRPCQNCDELQEKVENLTIALNEREEQLKARDRRIAELEEAMKKTDQPTTTVRRQQPPRNARKK